MQKALCDKDTSYSLHHALKGGTRYKGRHCLIIWDSTNGTKDALGSVLALTDTSGNVTDTYEYGEYGEQTASTGSSYNPYRFTGQQYDADSGMYFLRARYYDPSTGRFLGRDFLFIPGFNLYIYPYNPINHKDIDGRFFLQMCEVACIGLFATALLTVMAITWSAINKCKTQKEMEDYIKEQCKIAFLTKETPIGPITWVLAAGCGTCILAILLLAIVK